MSEPGSTPAPRIGDAERAAAMAALDEHLRAGRLDAVEYGDRSARASVARTAEDLRPLFADLPAPGPDTPPGAPPTAAVASSRPTRPPAERTGASDPARWGPRVSAALPFIALILFFTVPIPNAWVFFLLVPLGGALLAGTWGRGGTRRRGHDEDDDRDPD